MQICCALEVGTCFPEILQRMVIMAILSSITPLLNGQTSNKQFELTREIFKNNILSAVDSWRPCLHTRGKSIVRYLGRLRNYWKTLPSTKIGKTNSPSKNTAARSKGYPIDLVKNDPVNIVISTSYRLMEQQWFRQSAKKWVETLRPKLGFFYALLTSKGGNIAFPPYPLHAMLCRCSSYLYTENNKHTHFEWRGQGRGVDSFFSEVNLIE